MDKACASARNIMDYYRRIIVAGDPGVGKTQLIKALFELNRTSDYTEISNKTCMDVEGTNFIIDIDELSNLVEGCVCTKSPFHLYTVVVLCFAVHDIQNFLKVAEEELYEVEENSSNRTPFVLVATKCDLRLQDPRIISRRDLEMATRHLNAYQFIECSANTKKNVREVFIAAVKAREQINLTRRIHVLSAQGK